MSQKGAWEDFLETHFNPPGGELTDCDSPDWQPSPPAFQAIKDPVFRQWAVQINAIWQELCKKAKWAPDSTGHSSLS